MGGGGVGGGKTFRTGEAFWKKWFCEQKTCQHPSYPPEMGQKHPETRKSMIRAPQNMKKCKKNSEKVAFDGFGHVG